MPEQYGLLGKSLGHSFSKAYFTEKFLKEKIDAVYDNFELEDIGQLPELLRSQPDLRGLNVTIPYKKTVIPYLNHLSDEARTIGAVNTIKIQNGITTGHNTDAHGFLKSLRPFLTLHHDKALLLGNGGAAAAARYALESLGVFCLNVQRHGAVNGKSVLWQDLNERAIGQFKLIVNCTPLGMWPDTESIPTLSYDALTSDHLLFDMVYNPSVTRFMEKGRARGAITMNGSDMLRFQAERAWEIWQN